MADSDTIPTGFQINPYLGGLQKNKLLCRYLSMDKFQALLESESLWFTRIYNWKKGDTCEAILLPVFRNALKKPTKNVEAIDWQVADLELGLKSSFGCSFIEDDGYEKSHMWNIYCPDNRGYGVKIKLKADSVNNAIKGFETSFLRRIEYFSDADTNNMTIADTKHSNNPDNPHYFDAWESLFYKRKAYEAEQEVRAVVSKGLFRASYLLWFAGRHELVVQQFDYHTFMAQRGAPAPKDILRISFQDHEGRYFRLDLDMPSVVKLVTLIDDGFEATFPMLRDEKGINISISLNDIETIIAHPEICRDKEKMLSLKDLARKFGLGDKIVESELAKPRWY